MLGSKAQMLGILSCGYGMGPQQLDFAETLKVASPPSVARCARQEGIRHRCIADPEIPRYYHT